MKNTYTALIHGESGDGKTFNALQLPGKKILLSTDGSYNYAAQFAKNLTIVDVTRWMRDKTGKERCFSEQFDDAVAQLKPAADKNEPACIIVDNLSDLFDFAVLELKSSGQNADPRRDYLLVQEAIRRLSRQALNCGVNVLFTSWSRREEIVKPSGEVVTRFEPQIPAKIINSVCGLCNIVGRVTHIERDGKNIYYYDLTGSTQLLAKDQIWGRPSCYPQQLFTPPATPKPADKPRAQQAQAKTQPADKQTATEQGAKS